MINVLIVEDDPMVASINAEYIGRISGFSLVGTAYNGKDAIERLRSGLRTDLMILDVYMPRMNGLEMLELVRREFKNIDVIFVTAAKEKKVIQRGLELGAVDYLIKPFTFERIRQALEKYRQRYELLSDSDVVDQQAIDMLFADAAMTTATKELPKGVHPMTLSEVERAVDEAKEGEIDLSAMTGELGVTLVTLRVYLDYLTDRGALEKRPRRGAVGRPMYTYIKTKPHGE